MTSSKDDDLSSSGMTINLVSHEVTKQSYKRKVGQEIEVQEDGNDDDDDNPKKKNKKNQGGKKKKKNDKNESSSEFISSLFNNNPEIPQLEAPSEECAPLHEDIFSLSDFTAAGVHPYLVSNLSQMGLVKMTSVQSKAIPVILAGKDALIKSQTGSGKTLAYVLPIVHRLQEIRPSITRKDGIHALIIVPTRELAVQGFELLEKLCKSFARIVPGILSGGEKKKSEKARLRKGVNILVSTPGRLIDHIEHTECLKFGSLKFLILDEADRMLELGYERDVQNIISTINEQAVAAAAAASSPSSSSSSSSGVMRQTLLLSATLTTGIEQLSEISMKRPKFVDAAMAEDDASAMKTLTIPDQLVQTFAVVPAKLRLVTLAAFLIWKGKKKSIVFMSTQDMVDFHAELLGRILNHGIGDDDEGEGSKKFSLLRLHGSMSQKDRMDVFNHFRAAVSGVLLCTDVAARGLDLPQIDWIIQYNPPLSKADYVHRVGRTARIGTKGSSLLFLLPSESGFVKELEAEKLLLAEMTVEQVLKRLTQNGSRRMEEAATSLQMRMEEAVLDSDLHGRACQAYVSYVRSYASYPREIRNVFCFKELHLGHLAKSFALRDPPTKITGIGKGQWVRNDERKRQMVRKEGIKKEETVIKAQKKRINQKALVMSEYSTGFEGIQQAAARPKGKGRAGGGGRKFIRHPRKT